MPEQESIDSVYRRHGAAVYRRALQLLGSSAEAHEVVQDVFVSLFENPAQYTGKSSLTTFLYSATTHACLNRLRNYRTRERLLRERVAPGVVEVDSGLTPDQKLVLRRALADMPEELAQVLVYYCVDGLSHEEIAGLLSCSRRHVGNLLERVNAWGKTQEA
ncbi:MAG TPA: RNA polymerase sigma factor [Polyangiaceae bacterium]